MIKIEIIYSIQGTVYQDEAVAERANIKITEKTALIKTNNQTALYADAARVIMTFGYDGEVQPFTRYNTVTPPVQPDTE